MCGIIALLGNNNNFDYIINGLKQLENRGYDSAGICGIYNNNLIISKYASDKNIDSISKIKITKNKFINCNNFIAHTRWATHGPKTDINSHPHNDYLNKISLVHNGIIENFDIIKNNLIEKGIEFKSQTDTEVISNLIGYYYNLNNDLEKSILKATNEMLGTWALCIICTDFPDNIYCIRHGSPLLIGFNDDYIIISSEKSGFCNYINNYLVLKDNDLSVIKKENNKFLFEKINDYKINDFDNSIIELTPSPFKHWTIKEINEQYEASIRAISFGGRLLDDNEVKLGGLNEQKKYLLEIENLILLGCGTSLNAANFSKTFFRDLTNLNIILTFDGSEFSFDDIPKKGKTAFIIISQSGETKDLRNCIEIGKSNNCLLIGVVNSVDSYISREVDCGCYLNAGREVGVASTKAFTSQVILLSMIAIYLSQINNLNIEKRKRYIKCLRNLPIDIKNTLNDNYEIIEKISNNFLNTYSLFILGKNNFKYVADEGSLKIKEITYIHSESYALSALRHGPYALLNENIPVIFLVNDDSNINLINSTIEEIKSRNSMVYCITNNELVSSKSDLNIKVPKNELYSGLLLNIPIQLLSYNISIIRGNNPDKPRNLAKCVSV